MLEPILEVLEVVVKLLLDVLEAVLNRRLERKLANTEESPRSAAATATQANSRISCISVPAISGNRKIKIACRTLGNLMV